MFKKYYFIRYEARANSHDGTFTMLVGVSRFDNAEDVLKKFYKALERQYPDINIDLISILSFNRV